MHKEGIFNTKMIRAIGIVSGNRLASSVCHETDFYSYLWQYSEIYAIPLEERTIQKEFR
jgi:hypothetical protein